MSQVLLKVGKGSAAVVGRAGKNLRQYLVNLYSDYSTAMKEAWLDVKAKPWKGVLSVGTVGVLCYAVHTNPDKQHYVDTIVEQRLKLAQLSDTVRNPASSDYIQLITDYINRGFVRRTNCVLFSIIWKADYSENCNLYAAQCKQLKPKWRHLYKRVLDVGVFNRWISLDRAMIDYDINVEKFLHQ